LHCSGLRLCIFVLQRRREECVIWRLCITGYLRVIRYPRITGDLRIIWQLRVTGRLRIIRQFRVTGRLRIIWYLRVTGYLCIIRQFRVTGRLRIIWYLRIVRQLRITRQLRVIRHKRNAGRVARERVGYGDGKGIFIAPHRLRRGGHRAKQTEISLAVSCQCYDILSDAVYQQLILRVGVDSRPDIRLGLKFSV